MAISIDVSDPLAISSRDDLKVWVAEEVDRDVDEISDNLDKWILMAEARFNRDLRSPEMEKSAILLASGEDTALPGDYLAMRAVYEEGSPDRPLKAVSPTSIRRGFDGSTGTPVAYALVSNSIRLIPPPASEILLSLDYWAGLENLSTITPSNWLLDKHPDAYVTAILF